MIRKIIIILLAILMCFDNENEVPYIKKSYLSDEFGDGAVKTINQFIENTRDLDYETSMFFDYKTGELLKQSEGDFDGVELEFDSKEFEDKHVASIHNHHKNLISPPSGKNFGILAREFEDYELIAGYNEFWILEARGTNKDLLFELRLFSEVLHRSLRSVCSRNYPKNRRDVIFENQYGEQILNQINGKKIEGLSLTRVRYNYVRI